MPIEGAVLFKLYDLWVLRHKIGGAKVFVNNVQWSDQMMHNAVSNTHIRINTTNKGNNKITELRTILQRESKNS